MRYWGVVAVVLACSNARALPLHVAGCAPTAEAAVAHLLAKTSPAEDEGGFRVASVRVDRVRSRSWAMIASCTDATRPLLAVELPMFVAEPAWAAEKSVIHAGECVRVISRNGSSTMELTGTAEGSAALHGPVKVRLNMSLMGADRAGAELQGEAVEAGVVEVLQ